MAFKAQIPMGVLSDSLLKKRTILSKTCHHHTSTLITLGDLDQEVLTANMSKNWLNSSYKSAIGYSHPRFSLLGHSYSLVMRQFKLSNR